MRLPLLAVPGASVDVGGDVEDEAQSLAQTETVAYTVDTEIEVEVTVTVVSMQDELGAVGKAGRVLLIEGVGSPLLGAGVPVANSPVRRP